MMLDSIDRIPRGIYKSLMRKVYNELNREIIYEDRNHALPPMFNPTERYSPCHNTDYDLEITRKRVATRKYNKQHQLRSKQTFFEDYLKEI